ncbi:MAG: hypothetical protein KME29_14015 [Calothrix sp. FI2-JRJ7]|nr:hypothetical protein [Calothrix sp. FI2-JRJ7]
MAPVLILITRRVYIGIATSAAKYREPRGVFLVGRKKAPEILTLSSLKAFS